MNNLILKNCFSLFLFITTSILLAQNDNSAVNLLDKVKENYNNKTINLKFTHQTKNTESNINQTESGSAIINNQKYNISFTKAQTSQIYDGKKVYTISNDDKEISVSVPKNDSDLLTPTKVLDNYKNEYTIKSSGSKTVNKKKRTLVKLIPKKKSVYKFIEVALDSSKNEIVQIMETMLDSTISTLTINSITSNSVSTPATFSVDINQYKKKGYVVTEL